LARVTKVKVGSRFYLWNPAITRGLPFVVLSGHTDKLIPAGKIEGRWSGRSAHVRELGEV
ncbi:MAG TPA: hypothetical protein VGM98_00840, partial [Schlesneria sp.]